MTWLRGEHADPAPAPLPDPAPPPAPKPACALHAWQLEVEKGKRTLTRQDALWTAACIEASALEAERQGFHRAAASDRERAVKHLRDAGLRIAKDGTVRYPKVPETPAAPAQPPQAPRSTPPPTRKPAPF